MDFSKLPLTQMMTRKLAWLGARSAVLAQNVANADTPGYAARDLKPVDFAAVLRSAGPVAAAGRPAATHVRHQMPAGAGNAEFGVAAEAEPFETSLSGNSVSLEQQMAKVGETQLAYQSMIELYRKHLSLFRTALGRGSF